MSNELTVIQDQTAPAVYTAPTFSTGLEDVARLKPTNIILVQPTTRDGRGAQPGQFLDVLTEQPFDKLTVVALRVSFNRVLFPPGEDLNVEPLCRSDDGQVPSRWVKQPQASKCATCPHSQWRDSKRPACDEKIKMLVIVKESEVRGEKSDALFGLPRYITVGGISMKPLKNHLNALAQDIKRNELLARKGVGGQTAMFDYFFDITTEKVIGKRGVYFNYRFSGTKRVANVGEYGPIFEEYVVNSYNAQVEEEVASEAAIDNAVEAELVDATPVAALSSI